MSDMEREDNREYNNYKNKIWKAQNSLRNRLPKRVRKPVELWEKDKTPYQRFKINFAIKWRRFMIQTHGFGLIMIIMGLMSVVTMMVFLGVMSNMYDSISQLNKTKYREGLELSCTDKNFYAWNFRACEDIDIRPLVPQIPAPQMYKEAV